MRPTTACSQSACQQTLPTLPDSSPRGCSDAWRRYYRPLQVEPTEIRLIRILPDTFEAPIRCELLHTTLPAWASQSREPDETPANQQTDWQALSHVWGDVTTRETILLHGEAVSVRQNLHQCLRWLRHHGCVHPVWIDALCIDQTNVVERGLQVQAMPRIYRVAHRVIVYMAVKQGSTIDRLDMKQEIAKSPLFQSKKSLTDGIHRWLEGHEDPVLHAAAHVLQNEYWKRQWTVQEFVLARSLILVSGSLIAPVELIKEIQSKSYIFVRQQLNFGDTAYISTRVVALTGGRFGRRLSLRKEKNSRPLLEVLGDLRANSCSDPRDRIYGLLGLVFSDDTLLGSTLPVDYTLCTACVWLQATSFIIYSTKRLDVLAYCRYNLTRFQRTSWVPNWNAIDNFVERCRRRIQPSSVTPNWTLAADGLRLTAYGHTLGTTTQSVAASPSKEFIDQSTPEILQTYIDMTSQITKLVENPESTTHCVEMLAHLMAEFNSAVDEDLQSIQFFLHACAFDSFNETLLQKTGPLMVYLKAFLRDVTPTRLFLVNPNSHRPILGVSSHECHEGDVVCSLVGCDIPLIIRREATGDKIVGACAVPRADIARDTLRRATERDLETFQFD